MSDLRGRLHDVVDGGDPLPTAARGAAASDDVLVAVLSARVRRRRGVRAAAAGALSVVTVAAVAAGGVALVGRDGEPAPAASVLPGCGEQLRAPSPSDGEPLVLDVVPQGSVAGTAQLPALVSLTNASSGPLSWADATLDIAVVRDGTVVATGRGPALPGGLAGADPDRTWSELSVLDLVPCDGADLPAGEYALVAGAVFTAVELGAPGRTDGAVPAELGDSTVTASAAFTVTHRPPLPEPALTCGAPLPTELAADPALGASAEVTAAAPAGATVPWTVRWWSADAQPVSIVRADVEVAVLRDGVVVSTQAAGLTWDVGNEGLPTSEVGARLYSDATPLDDCAGEPLPAGDYDVVLTLTLTTIHDESLRASLGPWPLTLTPAGAAPTVPASGPLACGDATAGRGRITPPDAPVEVNGAVQPGAVRGLVVPVAALVVNTGDVDLAWPHTPADLVVTRGGVVVATATADLLPDAAAAGMAEPGPLLDVPLTTCDGGPLPAGTYAMWLHATFELPGIGPVEVLEGDWPFTVEAG